MSGVGGAINHKLLASLLLVLEMLTVLDLPTFRGSPWYEVPTRPHTIWYKSTIRYDGLVSIDLDIFLRSCYSAHESVMLVSSKSEVNMLGECVM